MATVGRLHDAWSAPVETSAAVVDGTTSFAAQGYSTGPSVVVARDLPTGATRWTSTVGAEGADLAADGAGNVVYATSRAPGSGSAHLSVSALSQANGKLLWRRTVAGYDGESLTYGGRRLYVTASRTTWAFDSSGRQLWQAEFSGDGGSYAGGRY